MIMVSDEFLREWMRKNYGEKWANNIELARVLYEKMQKKRKATIPTVEEEKEGIAIDVSVIRYKGCPICRRSVRKGCEHNEEPVMLQSISFDLVDENGDKTKVRYVCKVGEIDVGEGDYVRVVMVNGFVKEIEVIKKVEVEEEPVPEKDERIEEVLEIIKNVKMKEKVFWKLVEDYGIEKEKIIPFIEIRDGYVERKG